MLEKIPRTMDTQSIYLYILHSPLMKPSKFPSYKKSQIPSSKLNSLQNFSFLADFQPNFQTMVYTSKGVGFTGAIGVTKVFV